MSRKERANVESETSDTDESETEADNGEDASMSEEASENGESNSEVSDIGEEQLPVLNSIMKKGKVATEYQNEHNSADNKEEAERLAIREELSALSFEELQKLKEKMGSKKFNQTVTGASNKKRERFIKRANKNRPRELSSKLRRIGSKVAVQVPKVFRRDPRFDSLCGEFNEQKFHKQYEFVNIKMKEQEVEKLKEELAEATNPKQIDKIKYLIQRQENQIRSEKKRKEDVEKEKLEKQEVIDALKQGKAPHFFSKTERKEKQLKEKFDDLKKEGKLDQYLAKKRKHNAQRDRKHLPSIYDKFN